MNEQPPPMQNQQPNKERYNRPVPNEQDGFLYSLVVLRQLRQEVKRGNHNPVCSRTRRHRVH